MRIPAQTGTREFTGFSPELKKLRLTAGRPLRITIARQLDKSIFFTLRALIIFTAIPYGTVQPGWEAIFECTVFALGALWVCEGLLSGRWQVRGLELLAPLIAIVLFAFFQTLPLWSRGGANAGLGAQALRTISADPFETRLFAFKLVALVLAAELLLCYTSSRQRLRALVNVVIAVGLASAIFGIARQTMQGGAMGFLLPSLEPDRGFGQFINHNHFAFLMEMSLGVVLGLLVAGGVPRNRIFTYLLLAAPIWVALVLSNSRGGIFSMLCQVLILAVSFGMVLAKNKLVIPEHGLREKISRVGRSLAVRFVLAASLMIVVFVGVVWVGGDPLARRLDTLSGEVGPRDTLHTSLAESRTIPRRLEIWDATWQLSKAYPVAGSGFGGYWAAISEYHDASGDLTPQQAHNDYLELLASGGVIGIVLGAWFIVALIKGAAKQLDSTDRFRRAAWFGAMAGLFTVAIHSFVDFGLHITVNALVCVALLVIATVDKRVEETREEHLVL